MKKIFCLWFCFSFLQNTLFAQIKWNLDTTLRNSLEWNNYSTTYIDEDVKNSKPFILIAIPNNGMYNKGFPVIS